MKGYLKPIKDLNNKKKRKIKINGQEVLIDEHGFAIPLGKENVQDAFDDKLDE